MAEVLPDRRLGLLVLGRHLTPREPQPVKAAIMTDITWANEKRKLSDLIPWPRNPRQIKSDQVARLQDSLEEFGQPEVIAIGPGNEVYNGHQRLKSWAAKFGDIEVDVRVASRALTEKEREKLTVFLHKGAAGEWDFDVLANEFELDDLLEWGFEKKELDLDLWLPDPPEDPGAQIDRAEELREKWGVELGQLWQLGEHRLICGDCTERAVVERVMDNRPFNMIADPPYNINFKYQDLNDNLSPEEYARFCANWFSVCSAGSVGIIVTPGPKNERLYPSPRDKGIWLKRNASAGASVFHLRCCEPIYFYGKFSHKRDFDFFDYSSGFTDELRAAQRAARVEDEHPPAKPIELWKELIEMFCDGLIFDPFGGNGTTLMTCEVSKKKSATVEIYPPYCSVIIQRWVDMTGGEPVLIEDV